MPSPLGHQAHTFLCSMGDASGPGVHSTAPDGSKNRLTSLESGLIHGFSACFAVPLHTEELECRYQSPGSPGPTGL